MEIILTVFMVQISNAEQTVEEIIKGRQALLSKNYSTAKKVQSYASNEDIDEAIEHMNKNKIKLIGDKPTIGAENHKVIFIHPRSTGGILVELAEKIN